MPRRYPHVIHSRQGHVGLVVSVQVAHHKTFLYESAEKLSVRTACTGQMMACHLLCARSVHPVAQIYIPFMYMHRCVHAQKVVVLCGLLACGFLRLLHTSISFITVVCICAHLCVCAHMFQSPLCVSVRIYAYARACFILHRCVYLCASMRMRAHVSLLSISCACWSLDRI